MLHKVPLLDALYEISSEISYVLNRIQTCKHEVVINQNLTVYDSFNSMTDPDCHTVDDHKLYVWESCLSHIEIHGWKHTVHNGYITAQRQVRALLPYMYLSYSSSSLRSGNCLVTLQVYVIVKSVLMIKRH